MFLYVYVYVYMFVCGQVALVGLFRDLRGISQATTTKRTYNLLFDAVFPACFTLLKRATEHNYDDPQVMTALLKFLMVSPSRSQCCCVTSSFPCDISLTLFLLLVFVHLLCVSNSISTGVRL